MSQFDTQIRRLQRIISEKQTNIAAWKERLSTGTNDPRSQSSLRGHVTRAERDIEGYRAKICHLTDAMERSRTVRR